MPTRHHPITMANHQQSANVPQRIVLSNHGTGTQSLRISGHQQKCNGRSLQRILTTPSCIEDPPLFLPLTR